jgi:hypothetical protein
LVSSVRWEITRAVGSAHQSVFVALRRVRHEETVLMRLVRLRQRRWLLEHLVVKSTVDDSVPHAKNVPFAQLQHIQKHKKKMLKYNLIAQCCILFIPGCRQRKWSKPGGRQRRGLSWQVR